MIHTATLRVTITATEYWEMDHVASCRSYQKGKSYIKRSEYLSELGLILSAKKIILPANKAYYCADLFVNPSKLLGRKKVTDIYAASTFDEFRYEFNRRIKDYGLPWLPDLQRWKAHRIDYTFNIRTENVSLYVKLLQKSDITGFKPHLDSNNNRSMKRGSLYVLNKSITLNLYDKQDQLIKEQRSEEEIAEAQDVLRLEVQCHSRKLNGIKKKYDLDSKSAVEFMKDKEMGADILRYYIKKLTWNLQYYKKATAIAMINGSSFHADTKSGMIEMIEEVSKQYSSVSKVRATGKRIYKEQFKKLNLNPVTIGKNEKNVKISLNSLSDLLEAAIAAEGSTTQ